MFSKKFLDNGCDPVIIISITHIRVKTNFERAEVVLELVVVCVAIALFHAGNNH
jgi:hypothetical protein